MVSVPIESLEQVQSNSCCVNVPESVTEGSSETCGRLSAPFNTRQHMGLSRSCSLIFASIPLRVQFVCGFTYLKQL